MCISLSIPTTNIPSLTHESCIGKGGRPSAVMRSVVLKFIHRMSVAVVTGAIDDACFNNILFEVGVFSDAFIANKFN